MSLRYIRDRYGVAAKFHGRVRYTGDGSPKLGTIVGAKYGYVRIRLDGERRVMNFHPTWELEYLNERTS